MTRRPLEQRLGLSLLRVGAAAEARRPAGLIRRSGTDLSPARLALVTALRDCVAERGSVHGNA